MLEKKLLALGCAVGILACGACFFPPVGPPPAPRPRIDLGSSRRILVRVTNVSPTHHLDPVAVSQWITETINRRRQAGVPAADAGSQSMPGDAVLQVSIVKESIFSESANQAQTASRWGVQLTIDATVTRPDGTVVWRETNQSYRSGSWSNSSDSADPWSSPMLERWVQYYVCGRLVSQVLYGGG